MNEYNFKFGDWVFSELHGPCRFIARKGMSKWCEVLTKYDKAAFRLMTDLTPYAPADTVEVRIAVAVSDSGYHMVRLCDEGHADSDMERWVAQDLTDEGGFCRVSFVTARVPLPFKAAEVVGEVQP